MIIKLDFEDIDLVGIKTNYNGKVKSHYIRYIVDEYSIESAINKIKNNKWVVALDYEGDLPYLFNLKEKPSVPVIVTKVFEDVNELAITFLIKSLPEWVILAIKTPSNFSDMKLIYELSSKFSNIRFCGGKFLRLPGCNVGCIQKEDISGKIAESKIEYVTEGCACILPTMRIEDVEDVEGVDMLFKDSTSTVLLDEKEDKKMDGKKVVNNIEDLFNF